MQNIFFHLRKCHFEKLIEKIWITVVNIRKEFTVSLWTFVMTHITEKNTTIRTEIRYSGKICLNRKRDEIPYVKRI